MVLIAGQFAASNSASGSAGDRGLENLLLRGLGARELLETHDAEAGSVEWRDAFLDADLERRQRPAMQIGVAYAGEQRQGQRHVVHAPREQADMVERWAERMHAQARDRAEARLQSDDAIERRGPDHRAERLAAERERHEARRDRGGGAG
jgi:hypothetical protein